MPHVIEFRILRYPWFDRKVAIHTTVGKRGEPVFYCRLEEDESSGRALAIPNVTLDSTSAWVIQQLRESFPNNTAPKRLIFDRDTIFGLAVVRFTKAMGIEPARTAYRCP